MAQREKLLTPEGLKHLEEEFENLTSARRKEVAERIHVASDAGGTVDNAEYDEAKNEQAFVEGRISELEELLSNAVAAEKSKGGKGKHKVEFGSKVTVTMDGGRKQHYQLVGSAEAAPLEGKISVESPVGEALMGHKVGDKVKVATPTGDHQVSVTKID